MDYVQCLLSVSPSAMSIPCRQGFLSVLITAIPHALVNSRHSRNTFVKQMDTSCSLNFSFMNEHTKINSTSLFIKVYLRAACVYTSTQICTLGVLISRGTLPSKSPTLEHILCPSTVTFLLLSITHSLCCLHFLHKTHFFHTFLKLIFTSWFFWIS